MLKNAGSFLLQQEGDTMRIVLSGEIDHRGAGDVRCGIDEAIQEKRPAHLVLDLSRVEFMDSSGLGLIMGRYARMKETGGDLVLQNPTCAVEKILNLANMGRLVRIEKTAATKKSPAVRGQ